MWSSDSRWVQIVLFLLKWKLLLNYKASPAPHHLCQKQFFEPFMRTEMCSHAQNVETLVEEKPAGLSFREFFFILFKWWRRWATSDARSWFFVLMNMSSHIAEIHHKRASICTTTPCQCWSNLVGLLSWSLIGLTVAVLQLKNFYSLLNSEICSWTTSWNSLNPTRVDSKW